MIWFYSSFAQIMDQMDLQTDSDIVEEKPDSVTGSDG